MQKNLTQDEVAAWLGYASGDYFARVRHKLESEFGFPAPIPGLAKVLYSQLQLDAWLASLVPEAQRKALGQARGAKLDTLKTGATDQAEIDAILDSRTGRGKAA